MATYRLPEACRHQDHSAGLGAIDCSFEAGDVTPKSEFEEYALGKLTQLGLAEKIEAPPKKATKEI